MAERMTIHRLAEGLAAGEFSAEGVVRGYLDKIKARDGEIGAFLQLEEERVLAAARAADQRRAEGKALSEYDGIPIGVKDCIAVEGETCSCASKMLEGVVSPFDATAIARMRAKGFIPFGRLNMDEFAMGSRCTNSAFRKTVNPWNHEHVPGGSSGGSAACVAADFAPAALGSDTGGSIRQPASFCGIVGLKPTYGRVSRSGLVGFAPSLDQIGPMTNDVLDAAILLDAIAGEDPLDSTTLPAPAGGYAEAVKNAGNSLKGVRIGLPREYFAVEGLTPGVEKAVREAVEAMRQLGAEIIDVSLPHNRYAVPVYYIVGTAEASANLARFDGIRYGHRAEGKDLNDIYFKSRGEGFGAEVKRRILLGTYVLSSGCYDAYYLRAQKVRTLIRKDFDEAFKQCDFMLAPTSPTTAFRFDRKATPIQNYLSDILTIALNLSGNCGINLPAGFDNNNLPVGVQLMAPALAEKKLLAAAHIYLNR